MFVQAVGLTQLLLLLLIPLEMLLVSRSWIRGEYDARDTLANVAVSIGSIFNPVRIALHEYAGIVRDQLRPGLTWTERVGYFFGPPGWSRDGLSGTTADLRAAETARTSSAAPELRYGV
jgi:hypothetical protein